MFLALKEQLRRRLTRVNENRGFKEVQINRYVYLLIWFVLNAFIVNALPSAPFSFDSFSITPSFTSIIFPPSCNSTVIFTKEGGKVPFMAPSSEIIRRTRKISHYFNRADLATVLCQWNQQSWWWSLGGQKNSGCWGERRGGVRNRFQHRKCWTCQSYFK